MKTSLYHIQINISNSKIAIPFYKSLFEYLEYKTIDESSTHIGVSNETTDLWIIQTEEKYKQREFHRKATGINHLAFKVSSKKEVDRFNKEFLNKNKIKTLYNTPKDFPEYNKDYYAVFFEGPDRIKLEVVHIPKK